MQSNLSYSGELDSLPNQWINWCRLCAKEDKQQNINILYQNKEHIENDKKLSIQQALSKYFLVQCTPEDSFPKMLCSNCLSLVTSMINFNERVERVQLMFLHLTELSSSSNCYDLNAVRLKYDVFETERDLLFLNYPLNNISYLNNELTIKENSHQSESESKYKAQIKQEAGENLLQMAYDNYINEDSDLDKDEIVFDNNFNEAIQEDDEDPFQYHQNEQKSSQSSSNEDDETDNQQENNLKKEHEINSAVDRNKKRKKRRKLKPFSSLECKKKKNIKDIKLESTCKECGETFTNYLLYRDHMQQKHDQIMNHKRWPCPVCDKVLLSIFNLQRHVRIHVPLETRKTIKCPDCDNCYTSHAQLETHVKHKHKNEKPFICEECGLCLRTNSNLKQHMLTHTDFAPFECEVCKKKFKDKTRLKTHMDIHSPNKHICNICGLQLNSRATLNRHFLVHSDEMQHKCDYCGKAFKRAKALKNHLLLHTGLKPYSCDFCDRTFANGSNCRSHMKKMHPEELAKLEASGNKTHTKNIPKLETLKAVTKAADNLTPVVTKFSGCFAFGKKPKNLETNNLKQQQISPQKLKRSLAVNQIENEKLSLVSPASTPLDLQYTPLVGNNNTTSTCLPDVKNLDDLTALTSTTPIPNFNNIYQHLMKQNQSDIINKQLLSQVSLHPSSSNVDTPHTNNPFYHQSNHDIMNNALKSHTTDDLIHSPESHHSCITPLTHDDHSNASSLHGTFYGPIKTTLPPGNFM